MAECTQSEGAYLLKTVHHIRANDQELSLLIAAVREWIDNNRSTASKNDLDTLAGFLKVAEGCA